MNTIYFEVLFVIVFKFLILSFPVYIGTPIVTFLTSFLGNLSFITNAFLLVNIIFSLSC